MLASCGRSRVALGISNTHSCIQVLGAEGGQSTLSQKIVLARSGDNDEATHALLLVLLSNALRRLDKAITKTMVTAIWAHTGAHSVSSFAM